MIIRHLTLRHGRRAISRQSPFHARQWRSNFSSVVARRASEQDTREIDTLDEAEEALFGADAIVDPIVADFHFRNHQHAFTSKIGADKSRQYRPMDLLENPARPQDITLELLLASQTHLGHHTSLWHPGNARHIHGVWGEKHDSIHIISLDATASHLRRACKIVSAVAAKGGLILFVGTRKGQAPIVVRAAELAGACHLFDGWKPGTITNSHEILGKCAKKVVDRLDKELPGFEPQLRAQASLKPDLVICLNPLENRVLLHECGLVNIPTIGIVDTDCNPTWVTYTIPANDDSLRSVSVIAGALGQAGKEGQTHRLREAKAGRIPFNPTVGLRRPTPDELNEAKRAREALFIRDTEEEDIAELDEHLEDEAADLNHAPNAASANITADKEAETLTEGIQSDVTDVDIDQLTENSMQDRHSADEATSKEKD